MVPVDLVLHIHKSPLAESSVAAGAPPEGYIVFDYEMVKELLEKSIEFVEKKENR